MITIRRETPADYDAVYTLVQAAFATAEHADGDEQDLVVRLRGSVAFVPALSLVAEEDGVLAGHILFTGLGLGGVPALGLAPLSVAPAFQKRGVGTRLLEEGHRIARDLGYRVSVVVGSEHYYPRVGYRPASQMGIGCPFPGMADENFMALVLQGGPVRLDCTAEYPKEMY